MDFAFTDEQEALRELARKILADHVTHERLQARSSASADWFDREPVARARPGEPARRWRCRRSTAAAGSASSSCVCCSRRSAARSRRCRCCATLVLGALPIARVRQRRAAAHAAARRRRRRGHPHAPRWSSPARAIRRVPATAARADGGALAARRRQDLRARRAPRDAHPRAGAHAGDGVGLFLVDPQRHGRDARARRSRTNGEPQCRLTLAGARSGETTCSAIPRRRARSSPGSSASAPSPACARAARRLRPRAAHDRRRTPPSASSSTARSAASRPSTSARPTPSSTSRRSG